MPKKMKTLRRNKDLFTPIDLNAAPGLTELIEKGYLKKHKHTGPCRLQISLSKKGKEFSFSEKGASAMIDTIRDPHKDGCGALAKALEEIKSEQKAKDAQVHELELAKAKSGRKYDLIGTVFVALIPTAAAITTSAHSVSLPDWGTIALVSAAGFGSGILVVKLWQVWHGR